MADQEYDQHIEAMADYDSQAREFLAKGQEYLTAGDLHQASEKGWSAAAHMAKAVATAQGWQYDRHPDFSGVMNQAALLTGNDRLRDLRARANDLHGNYYLRKRLLDAESIERDLDSMAELLELLAALTAANP